MKKTILAGFILIALSLSFSIAQANFSVLYDWLWGPKEEIKQEVEDPTIGFVYNPVYFKKIGNDIQLVNSSWGFISGNSTTTNATTTGSFYSSGDITAGGVFYGDGSGITGITGTGITNLNAETLGSIGDVSTTTLAYGSVLSWDTSNWVSTTTLPFFGTEWDKLYNATTTLSGFTNNQANWNTAYGWGDHSGLYLLDGESDTMTGTLTADGFILGSTELLTIGSNTLTHNGTDFVFNDTVAITGYSTSTLGVNSQGTLHIGGNSTFDGTGHDSFSDFVANEHLDWTASVGTIHADNYTDTNTTYLGGTNLTLDSITFNVDDKFLKNDASDIMVGTLTADGLTLGANENITLGAQTLDHDGTTFVFNDDVNITGTATSTNSGNTLTSGNTSTTDMFISNLLHLPGGMCIGELTTTTTPNVTIQACSEF